MSKPLAIGSATEHVRYVIELVWDPELDDHFGRVLDADGNEVHRTRPHDLGVVAEEAAVVACQIARGGHSNPDDQRCAGCGHERRRHWAGTGPSGFTCQECECGGFRK